ncbi:beta-N-acetylhexosaminidase [Pedobacter punctiformis]|uniref:beta-N-acetylhexosaminidase n=1 Tax=Pedobacter punctiformis TaxID=3004097 RepID=A0ABT4LBC9_9SPHI|nr:beta-N-acetylhexosaminidase [Pedobacter sp. HCMS5-2]MCZ4244109.1 beta-N-acetylhexosaminidase [Pedobacter sp. HCMS5-2]
MLRLKFTLIFCLIIIAGYAQDLLTNHVIPKLLEVKQQSGNFVLKSTTPLICEANVQPAIKVFAGVIRNSTGYKFKIETPDQKKEGISFKVVDTLQSLGNEGYKLIITPNGINILAKTNAGIFNATQTLRQLLPAEIEGKNTTKIAWTIPCGTIIDKPRYAWRGYMQDVSRTFYGVDVMKKYMDVMALYKINVLHLHLTDDQGWRIEIKKYPELTSERTTVFSKNSNQPAERSGFYTQAQIKDLVKYAAERNITIVPEIDVPGHSWPTTLAYPALGINNNHTPNFVFPFLDSWSYWGNQFTPNTLDPTNEKVYQFLNDVFTELAELFPAQYIHFGGDEVRHILWEKEPHVQQFMKEKSLKNTNELQSYFVSRVSAIIKQKGKKPIGWNDILSDAKNLTKETAIMSWLGDEAIADAAKNGFYVVATPTDPLYFDITQADRNDGTMSDLAYGNINSIDKVYNYEPEQGLTPEEGKFVLGVQANQWTAITQEVKDMNIQNFPRVLALAEIGWIPKEHKNLDQFKNRLNSNLNRLDVLKVDYYRPGGYIAGNWNPSQIKSDYNNIEWDVTKKTYANGRITAGLFYTGGANFLEIKKAVLLENGIVVSEDEHTGIADKFRGTHKTKTFLYHLKVDHYNPKAKYTLQVLVRGIGGKDSKGNLTYNLSPYHSFTVVEGR